MANVIITELGFPVVLVDPPMITVRGQTLPDVNLRALAEAVFDHLIIKPTRLTGDEVRFVRKHLRLRQADLARVLNMANHSVVSQWESHGDDAAAMDYNTEVLLRIWMASKAGQGDRLVDLLERGLKNLQPSTHEPLALTFPTAAQVGLRP